MATTSAHSDAPSRPRAKGAKRRGTTARGALTAHGEPMLWLTGGGLAICLLMIVGLLVLVFWQGMSTFWPTPVAAVKTPDGLFMGEIARAELYEPGEEPTTAADAETDEIAVDREDEEAIADENVLGLAQRRLFRTGNFDITGTHFHWINDAAIEREWNPEWAIVVERLNWGRFYGFPSAFILDDEVIVDTDGLEGDALDEARAEIWALFNEHHAATRSRWREREHLEETVMGAVNYRVEQARLAAREVALTYGEDSSQAQQAQQRFERVEAQADNEYNAIADQIQQLNVENERFKIQFVTLQGEHKIHPLHEIVRAYPPNQLGVTGKSGVYLSRWWEFLSDDPREANSEGGVFPAIFGTVLMTLIMSLVVVPFGVLAALYLREYAKAGPIVSAVRIAVNNLAGVPSIVFGVFGLGFFCYLVGGYIDGGPAHIGYDAWSLSGWLAAFAIWLAAAVAGPIVWVMLLSRLRDDAAKSLRAFKWIGAAAWILAMGAMLWMLVVHVPFFDGLYRAKLPNPTFGTGGILWASLTLALLTLPVVIVATEEALAAVPGSMREGSYACGASKWQTVRRIVLPRAMPGIMTGTILAMARGAGEVAPLMLVGAVKLAPELPMDGNAPWVHLERSFMHLGFHVYDLGFQSQNSEAAKPMVFTTTLLLISLIAALNLSAIWLRSRLRRKFVSTTF
ncbi:MAG: ABC transporter permease subunit [bacterium]